MAAQVFRLSFGPKSFVVVSDAAVARHMLMTNAANYSKGILSEILDFIMGSGEPPLLLCGSQHRNPHHHQVMGVTNIGRYLFPCFLACAAAAILGCPAMLVAVLASPGLLQVVCFCIKAPIARLGSFFSCEIPPRGLNEYGARYRLGGGALQRYLSEVIESRISSRVVSRKRGLIIGMQGSNTEM